MNEWWAGLSVEQQIYWSIGSVATVLVLLQTLLLLIGGATELAEAGDADMGEGTDHPSGIRLLSSRTVVAFFVGFGWTGVVASREGVGDAATTALAGVLVGGLFAAVILFLMRFLHTLRHSGSLDYRNALGEVGTVYLPVPAAMAGTGRIQVVVQGRLKVIEALTRRPPLISNGSRVRVVELVDQGTLVVEPLTGRGAREED
jgi:hypothetical protein